MYKQTKSYDESQHNLIYFYLYDNNELTILDSCLTSRARDNRGIRESQILLASLRSFIFFIFENLLTVLRIGNQALVCKWKISRTSLASTNPSELNSI